MHCPVEIRARLVVVLFAATVAAVSLPMSLRAQGPDLCTVVPPGGDASPGEVESYERRAGTVSKCISLYTGKGQASITLFDKPELPQAQVAQHKAFSEQDHMGFAQDPNPHTVPLNGIGDTGIEVIKDQFPVGESDSPVRYQIVYQRGCYLVYINAGGAFGMSFIQGANGAAEWEATREWVRATAAQIDEKLRSEPCPGSSGATTTPPPTPGSLGVTVSCQHNFSQADLVVCTASPSEAKSDAVLSYQWTFDGAAQSIRGSELTLTGVAPGDHSVSVIASDSVNQLTSSPQSVSFTKGAGGAPPLGPGITTSSGGGGGGGEGAAFRSSLSPSSPPSSSAPPPRPRSSAGARSRRSRRWARKSTARPYRLVPALLPRASLRPAAPSAGKHRPAARAAGARHSAGCGYATEGAGPQGRWRSLARGERALDHAPRRRHAGGRPHRARLSPGRWRGGRRLGGGGAAARCSHPKKVQLIAKPGFCAFAVRATHAGNTPAMATITFSGTAAAGPVRPAVVTVQIQPVKIDVKITVWKEHFLKQEVVATLPAMAAEVRGKCREGGAAAGRPATCTTRTAPPRSKSAAGAGRIRPKCGRAPTARSTSDCRRGSSSSTARSWPRTICLLRSSSGSTRKSSGRCTTTAPP